MNAIQDALAPVLRDVAATTDVDRRIGDRDWTDDRGPYVWISTADRSATQQDVKVERIAA